MNIMRYNSSTYGTKSLVAVFSGFFGAKSLMMKMLLVVGMMIGMGHVVMAQTQTVYELTNTITSGKNYLFVNSNIVGNAYALGHSGTTINKDDVIINAGTIVYINNSDVDATSVWTATASSTSWTFKNDNYYIRCGNGGGLSINTTNSNRNWTYDGTDNTLYNNSKEKYLRYINNWSCGDDGVVYIFEEKIKPTYSITWSIDGVPSDDTYIAGHILTDANIPIPTSSDCDGSKIFVGWTTLPIATPQNSAPTPFYSNSTLPTVTGNATYYAVFATDASTWDLVSNVSSLSLGDKVVIAASGYNYAISTTQNNNNRGQADITKSGSAITWSTTAEVCEFELKEGTETGSWAFYDSGRNGYIYAASSNNNYLRTQAINDVNSSWFITISNGVTTVVAERSTNRNHLRYNNGSSIFSCYQAGKQKPVVIYKRTENIYGYITECTSCRKPTSLTISDITSTTANISWNGTADNYQVRYAAMQTLMFEGFETGIPDGWQNVDADGDGHSWMQSSVLMSGYPINPYGGDDMLSSESYDYEEEDVLIPDNWLITSQITLPDVEEIKIKFYVAAQDEDYSEEHYGVYLSTTGSGIVNFDNELLNETLPENSGIWYEKVIDITSYKGRSVYIAIRHFNCTDQFYLNIDNFGIYYKEWLEEETSNTSLNLTGLTPNTEYEVQVRADCEDDEYSSWMSTTFTTICGVIELPYFQGFEDDFSCWSLENCDASTGLSSDAAKTGNAGFLFSYNTNPPQYLISPRINATEEFHLRFYYKNYSDSYPETFQVGYSTGGSRGVIDENSFTWSDEITAADEDNWMEYTNTFPAETQYIAIKLTSDDQFSLFIDDIDIYYNYPLPIELVSFTASCNGRSSLVEWTTATEKNNDFFVLERSTDAVNFKEIARVAGAGNSIEPINYAYTDYGARSGDNYYRLVQVDYDGTSTASEIIVANCLGTDGEPEVLAYPNPFGDDLTLRFENFGNIQATVEVYDMLGRMVHTQKINCSQNDYEVVLRLAGLSDGTYNVRISAKEMVINRQVIKN